MNGGSGQDEQLGAQLRDLLPQYDIHPLDRAVAAPQIGPKRAGLRRPIANRELLALTRQAGVLRWEVGPGVMQMRMSGRRAAGRAALPAGQIVHQFTFERLEPSQIGSVLRQLDRKLTPNAWAAPDQPQLQGLRRVTKAGQEEPVPVDWAGENAVAAPADSKKKRVFLLIHGTFSNCENVLSQLRDFPEGQKLLADIKAQYDDFLAFNHPTVGVSPAMNAFDLAGLLRPLPEQIDIVCHSRGGLVTRWFCEGFADPSVRRRVVFVASPLAGTSLAAPPRIRSAMQLLANIADVLRRFADLGAANPFFAASSVIMRVLSTITGAVAKTPLVDAAVAMVPGLSAQSRVGNNEEIDRLRRITGNASFGGGTSRLEYGAVKADFRPTDPGWNFLQWFSRPMLRVADMGADIIFDAANDLVVDTAAMDEVADGNAIKTLHDFGTGPDVHHCNYFRQPKTVEAIRAAFQIN